MPSNDKHDNICGRHPYNKAGDGPEGPEVRKMAEMLNNYLPGYYITHIDIKSGKYNSLYDINLPIIIDRISVKGKKIIFILTGNHNDNNYNYIYLVSGLGMTGVWEWKQTPHTRVIIKLSKYNPITKQFDPSGKVYYNDSRNFGNINIYKSDQSLIDSFKGKVGKDMLNENVPYNEWRDRAKKVRMDVCKFLSEQKYFSGVGNIYRSEIAYRARINPTRLMKSLSDNEMKRLYDSILYVLRDAYEGKGYAGYKIYENSGTYNPSVYKKPTDPMGNKVETVKCSDKRTLYWVPSVQK
jgi:formamidopyrimidine-DNA glycosylase